MLLLCFRVVIGLKVNVQKSVIVPIGEVNNVQKSEMVPIRKVNNVHALAKILRCRVWDFDYVLSWYAVGSSHKSP